MKFKILFQKVFYPTLKRYYVIILRLRLFFTSVCVCDETNAARCLVTNQTAFCIVEPIKKLSLKRSFYEEVFTCFFN